MEGQYRRLELVKPCRRDSLRMLQSPLEYSRDFQLEIWWETFTSAPANDFDIVELTLKVDIANVKTFVCKKIRTANNGMALVSFPDLKDNVNVNRCNQFRMWVEIKARETEHDLTLQVATPPIRFTMKHNKITAASSQG